MTEPIAERKRYFAPYLGESEDPYAPDELSEPSEENPANVTSSLRVDGWHSPALDIDIPCEFIPSSTEGHGHLYFPDVILGWDQYVNLLEALEDAGILGPNYVRHSIRRGQSILRLPGVKKERKVAA